MRSPSSGRHRTIILTQNPVRMFFKKLTLCISHFRLNPNTELYFMFIRQIQQSFNTLRKFLFAYRPVSQTGRTVITRIFITKPSIIHHKKLTPHSSHVFHHLPHTFLVHLEINTFPTIQQNISFYITLIQFILTCPAMKSTTDTSFTLCTIRHGKLRCTESFFRF